MVQITTDNQGRFSTQLENISVGEHTINIEYAGDDNYTSSSVTRDITVVEHIYAIDLYSNNPIIETGDTTSVIATLTDDNIPVAGETLSYTIKHGSTTITTGTGTTDNNGQITIPYTGTGIGDVDVIVSFGISLQETFVVEDCSVYNPTKYTSNQYNLNYNLPNGDWSIEYVLHRTNGSVNSNGYSWITLRNNNKELFVGQTGSLGILGLYAQTIDSSTYDWTETSGNIIPNDTDCKIIVTLINNVLTVKYGNNTQTHTLSSNEVPTIMYGYEIGSLNSAKELKIKAL